MLKLSRLYSIDFNTLKLLIEITKMWQILVDTQFPNSALLANETHHFNNNCKTNIIDLQIRNAHSNNFSNFCHCIENANLLLRIELTYTVNFVLDDVDDVLKEVSFLVIIPT